MHIVRTIAAATLLASLVSSAHATAIDASAITGAEHKIDFDGALPASLGTGFTTQGVTFVAYQSWALSASLLGTTGNALNETSEDQHDITLVFDKPITRFGATFGNCGGCFLMKAIVGGFDANVDLVEYQQFDDFYSSFVGFDFDAPVTSVLFHRMDATRGMTFLDDIRYVYEGESLDGTGTVPESGSLALLGLGALGATLARRRRA